jgi:hypothetical protein
MKIRILNVTVLAPAIVGALIVSTPDEARAQTTGPATVAAEAPANPADVASLDAIISALYASISGPKGAPRDFPRMRSLMIPSARLTPTGIGRDSLPRIRSWNIDEYIAAAGPGLMANGFYEREIGRRTTSYGNVWHIMSAYDSRYTPESTPFSRGVNSIQLFNGGSRWYIVSIFWDSERPGNPIPADLLSPSR